MTPELFCGWLQGFLEARGLPGNNGLSWDDAAKIYQMVRDMNINTATQKAQERQPATWVEGRPIDWHKLKTDAGGATQRKWVE